jgi:hypothetical protein
VGQRLNLAQAAHLYLKGGKGLLAMLGAYLDCSGHSHPSKNIVLAGFVADVERWTEFEQWWDELLAEPRYGVPYIHARKIDKAWKRDKLEQFHLEANYMLKKIGAIGVSGSMRIADYKHVFPDNTVSNKDSMYGFCFRAAFAFICNYVAIEHPGKKVSFIIEQGDPGQDGAVRAFHLTEASRFSDAMQQLWPLGTLTIAKKGDYGALDTADMHAFSLWQKQSEAKGNWRYLLNGLRYFPYQVDRQDLATQKQNMTAKGRHREERSKEIFDEAQRLAEDVIRRRTKGGA